jgi:hypothetical protein
MMTATLTFLGVWFGLSILTALAMSLLFGCGSEPDHIRRPVRPLDLTGWRR